MWILPFVHGGMQLVQHAAHALFRWHRRQQDLQVLRSLDERTLRDIGLSHRAAAERPRAGWR
jgi:uncharacterized protein YjiS (DUF1127 family)